MAFVAEDGTGIANANSLASVAFADNYHSERGNVAWAAFDNATKQYNLIKATDYVVDMFALAFAGQRVTSAQGLPFPRTVDYVNVGNPLGVQKAVAELALVASSTPLTPNITRGKKSVKVGSIQIVYDGNAPTQTMFVTAVLKLVPFLRDGAMNSRCARLIRT